MKDEKMSQDEKVDAAAGQEPEGTGRSALLPMMSGTSLGRGLKVVGGGASDDVVMAASRKLAHRHEVSDIAPEPEPAEPPRTRRGPRSKSPIAPDVEIPYEGEVVPWCENFRAEVPEYVFRQIEEFCFRTRRTQVSALLVFLDQFTDDSGRKLFSIRREDMVNDRRKILKRGRTK